MLPDLFKIKKNPLNCYKYRHLKLHLVNKTANINGNNFQFTTKWQGRQDYSSKMANIILVGLHLELYHRSHVENRSSIRL